MNWKNLRFWYADGSLYTQTGNGNISEEGLGNASWMCAWHSPTSAECKDGISEEQTRGYSDGRWNTEQFIGRAQSGSGKTDGYFEYIVNGRRAAAVPYRDYAQKVFVMAQGTPGEAYYVHDVSANDPDPPSGARTWWDDIYVDRTWARVMLSSSPTWGTSSAGPLYEIQIPTAWSTSSITVQVNVGELPSGSAAYLYVVDATGAANASGFPVTIGGDGGGGGSLPAPTNLSSGRPGSWPARRALSPLSEGNCPSVSTRVRRASSRAPRIRAQAHLLRKANTCRNLRIARTRVFNPGIPCASGRLGP
jgi:hypothetical protein